MGDNDDTPPSGKKRLARLASEPGRNRDVLVHKHPDNPFGVVIVENGDGLTPPPMAAPDPIEDAALKFDRRTKEIARRPGPTPTQSSIVSAISTSVVLERLDDLKATITNDLLDQIRKDRDIERQRDAAQILAAQQWGDLWRSLIWKVVAAGAVVFAILREYFATRK